MAGLDPAIQSFFGSLLLAYWMAASRAAMTKKNNYNTSRLYNLNVFPTRTENVEACDW